MACVVVLSLMRTLELEFLQPLPRPILQQNQLIPCNKGLVLSLHNKLGFLMELFDENRMDGVEAIKDLETKLRDVAFRIEDEIELQVVDLYEEERDEGEEEENRVFAGIIDIFDRFVDQTFQPPENHIYVEMPQDDHCQSLHQTTTHHCQRLHQILHPPTGKSHPCLKFRRILHPAIQDIDSITEELAKVKEEYQLFKHHLQAGTKQPASLHILPIPTDQVITMPDSSHTASHSKEIMVGKQDEFEIIKDKLIQHPSKQREIVSIKVFDMAATTDTSTSTIVHLNAPTHFPIKLTTSNFPVWRRQIESTLIGLNLDGYIIGTVKAPARYLDTAETNINPDYTRWFRQDQILVSALLGSCSDTLQPLISSASTAHDAWKRLASSCAATSRGRVVSLKAKLAKNPKGSRTIVEYLRDMRAIADDLALVQSPVSDEDLTVHIITQLGDEYNAIVAALRVRETPISLGELSDVLTDFERVLKEGDAATQQVGMVTANVTTKRPSHMPSVSHSNVPRDQNGSFNSRRHRGGFNGQNARTNYQGGFNGNITRPQRYCRFCDFSGHETRFCRKLAKFLKDNNIHVVESQVSNFSHQPTVNTTMASTMMQPPWVMDTGASHHTVSNPNSLQSLADYSGPDEIMLGNGSSHGGATNARGDNA